MDSDPAESPEPSTPETLSPDKPQHQTHKPRLIVGLVLALIAVAGFGGWWHYYGPGKPQAAVTAPIATMTPQPSATPLSKADALLQRFQKPTTGETWLAKPKKIADQGYFASNDAGADYYEVGKHGTATIIMSVVQQIGEVVTLYEKGADGKVTAILHPDGEAVYNEDSANGYAGVYRAGITLNKTTYYDSLTMPNVLTLSNGYAMQKSTYPELGQLIDPATDKASGATYTTVMTVGQSVVQRRDLTDAATKLTSIGYVLQTPLGTRQTLGFTPLELNLANYQFEHGTIPADTLSPITRGCGGITTAVTRSDVITAADVQTAGKSPSGLQIYELKDVNNALMTKAYQEFLDFFKDSPDSTPYYNISRADFAKEHAVIIYKDTAGEWLVYARDQLRPQGGCAKPVIYLYPQQSEAVSVRVGANVKVSVPLYSAKTGWSNVWAQPNGNLSVNGQAYDSLYWEGPGSGLYPAITSGTVVSRGDAERVIREQLTAQGLNAKESADFMAYWAPRLPNKPYVRLTWFDTAQMNGLAPLAISPRPTTVLRVFLDFDGLDQPISLPAQHLSATPRTGFTVVEWGGLSQAKLY